MIFPKDNTSLCRYAYEGYKIGLNNTHPFFMYEFLYMTKKIYTDLQH